MKLYTKDNEGTSLIKLWLMDRKFSLALIKFAN